jgi:hypothetical protein
VHHDYEASAVLGDAVLPHLVNTQEGQNILGVYSNTDPDALSCTASVKPDVLLQGFGTISASNLGIVSASVGCPGSTSLLNICLPHEIQQHGPDAFLHRFPGIVGFHEQLTAGGVAPSKLLNKVTSPKATTGISFTTLDMPTDDNFTSLLHTKRNDSSDLLSVPARVKAQESSCSDHTQELGPSSVVPFVDPGAGVPFVGSLHVSPGGKHPACQVVLAPKDVFSCQSDAAVLDGNLAISDSFTEEAVDSFSLTQRVKKNIVDLAEQKISARRTDKDEDTMSKAQLLAGKRNLEINYLQGHTLSSNFCGLYRYDRHFPADNDARFLGHEPLQLTPSHELDNAPYACVTALKHTQLLGLLALIHSRDHCLMRHNIHQTGFQYPAEPIPVQWLIIPSIVRKLHYILKTN